MVGAREKVVGILATTPVNRLHFPMTNVVIHKEISVCTWMFAACAYYWWCRKPPSFDSRSHTICVLLWRINYIETIPHVWPICAIRHFT